MPTFALKSLSDLKAEREKFICHEQQFIRERDEILRIVRHHLDQLDVEIVLLGGTAREVLSSQIQNDTGLSANNTAALSSQACHDASEPSIAPSPSDKSEPKKGPRRRPRKSEEGDGSDTKEVVPSTDILIPGKENISSNDKYSPIENEDCASPCNDRKKNRDWPSERSSCLDTTPAEDEDSDSLRVYLDRLSEEIVRFDADAREIFNWGQNDTACSANSASAISPSDGNNASVSSITPLPSVKSDSRKILRGRPQESDEGDGSSLDGNTGPLQSKRTRPSKERVPLSRILVSEKENLSCNNNFSSSAEMKTIHRNPVKAKKKWGQPLKTSNCLSSDENSCSFQVRDAHRNISKSSCNISSVKDTEDEPWTCDFGGGSDWFDAPATDSDSSAQVLDQLHEEIVQLGVDTQEISKRDQNDTARPANDATVLSSSSSSNLTTPDPKKKSRRRPRKPEESDLSSQDRNIGPSQSKSVKLRKERVPLAEIRVPGRENTSSNKNSSPNEKTETVHHHLLEPKKKEELPFERSNYLDTYPANDKGSDSKQALGPPDEEIVQLGRAGRGISNCRQNNSARSANNAAAPLSSDSSNLMKSALKKISQRRSRKPDKSDFFGLDENSGPPQSKRAGSRKEKTPFAKIIVPGKENASFNNNSSRSERTKGVYRHPVQPRKKRDQPSERSSYFDNTPVNDDSPNTVLDQLNEEIVPLGRAAREISNRGQDGAARSTKNATVLLSSGSNNLAKNNPKKKSCGRSQKLEESNFSALDGNNRSSQSKRVTFKKVLGEENESSNDDSSRIEKTKTIHRNPVKPKKKQDQSSKRSNYLDTFPAKDEDSNPVQDYLDQLDEEIVQLGRAAREVSNRGQNDTDLSANKTAVISSSGSNNASTPSMTPFPSVKRDERKCRWPRELEEGDGSCLDKITRPSQSKRVKPKKGRVPLARILVPGKENASSNYNNSSNEKMKTMYRHQVNPKKKCGQPYKQRDCLPEDENSYSVQVSAADEKIIKNSSNVNSAKDTKCESWLCEFGEGTNHLDATPAEKKDEQPDTEQVSAADGKDKKNRSKGGGGGEHWTCECGERLAVTRHRCSKCWKCRRVRQSGSTAANEAKAAMKEVTTASPKPTNEMYVSLTAMVDTDGSLVVRNEGGVTRGNLRFGTDVTMGQMVTAMAAAGLLGKTEVKGVEKKDGVPENDGPRKNPITVKDGRDDPDGIHTAAASAGDQPSKGGNSIPAKKRRATKQADSVPLFAFFAAGRESVKGSSEGSSGNGMPSRRPKATRRFDPLVNGDFSNNNVLTGTGFACPRCSAACSYDERKCSDCGLECYYEAGVGVVVLKERRVDAKK